MSKYNFIRINPVYTGGGIYIFTGRIENIYNEKTGVYIMSDIDYFMTDGTDYVEFYRVCPYDLDKSTDPVFSENYMIYSICDKDAKKFISDMLKWIIENKPQNSDCNYNMLDIENRLKKLKGDK